MSGFPKQSFLKLLQVAAADTTASSINTIASEKCERFVPANTATTFTLGNAAIPDFTMIWKNGTLMDDGAASPAYSIKGRTVTLLSAANGTDVFIVRYHFRAS